MGKRLVILALCWGCMAPVSRAQSPASAQLVRDAAGLGPGQMRVDRAPFVNTSVLMGRALGVVNAPRGKVVKILEDYANYAKFMPHFRASKVLSSRGSSALVYMEAEAAHGAITIWVQLKLKAETLADQTRVITGKLVKGNVSMMHAVWKVAAVDERRSVVYFEILMDPDLPLPDSLVNSENEKAARQSFKALRALVEK